VQTGYIERATAIMKATDAIRAGLSEMKDVTLLGSPAMSILCLTTTDPAINIFAVNEAMSHRGWALNALQFPRSLHICLTYMHRDAADGFLKDLAEAIAEVRYAHGRPPRSRSTWLTWCGPPSS
jgi:sphinganine-1-phosphate aldolase